MQTETPPLKHSALIRIFLMANPIFVTAAIVVPVGALIYTLNFGPHAFLKYVHVMTGGLWTGIDIFMGAVLGPVLGGMEPKDRANVFKRLMPRMTFLMPVLAGVTTTAGIKLASQMGFPLTSTRIIISFVITGILTVQGFGVLLPNEIRIFRQLLSDKPDIEKIASLGMLNARLGGVQGVFQFAIIFLMATLRF